MFRPGAGWEAFRQRFGKAALGAAGPSAPGAAELTPEELQVVVAALNGTALREVRSFVLWGRRDAADAVVPDATLASCTEPRLTWCIAKATYATITRLLAGSSSGLADAFISRTATSSTVEEVAEHVSVVPASELWAMFRPGAGWEAFRQRFGKAALVQFSAPAIEGDQAVVYVTSACGSLCGKSWLVTLERRGRVFRVRKSQVLAVS